MTLDDLFPASFRGIPFLVNDTNTTGGSKQVVHEYPNDKRRFVENLGPLKKNFNLTGVIAGSEYLVNRNALQSALEDGSIGILVHPFYGIQSVSPLNYTVRETTTRLGEAVFDINFAVSDPAINPTDSGNSISKIIAEAEAIEDKLQSAFALAFKFSSFYKNSYKLVKTKLSALIPSFDGFKQSFGRSAVTDTEKLTTKQNVFSANLSENISKPAVLISSISDLFTAAHNVSDDAILTGQAFQSLFSFGFNDAEIKIINADSAQRKKNNLVINYTINIYALMYAYLNYSQADFEDDVQLNMISAQLEAQYRKIILGDVVLAQPVETLSVIDSDTLTSLKAMRNLFREQLESDSATVAKIDNVTISTPTSASLISYQYYGETSEARNIIDLNDIADASFVSGNIRVRTGAGLTA